MAELQEKYQQRYKGRKGQKKLREINERIDQICADTIERYDAYQEMDQIRGHLQDPEVLLYFTECYQKLDMIWSGALNAGLLRLCGKWIRSRNIEEMTAGDVDEMLRELLPSDDWRRLKEGESA